MRRESGRTFDPVILAKFLEIIDELEVSLPVLSPRPSSLIGSEPLSIGTGHLIEAGLGARTRTEKALRDISAAQREVLSLYEISQTLGSSLKLSEVLPIVATKLENIQLHNPGITFRGERLRAAYVMGAAKQTRGGVGVGEGGAGWVAEHRQVLIGGSPLADLERSLGAKAAAYRSTAIFPLLQDDTLVGTLALYSEEDCAYSTDEVRLLETISSHAASALQNALVFERTQNRR